MAASQVRAVLSALAVASQRPSGLNVTAETAPSWLITRRGWPVAASQVRAVPSVLAVASQRPSGLNASPSTPSGAVNESERWLEGDCHQRLAVGGTPDTDGVAGTARRQPPAIRCEGDCMVTRTFMADAQELLSGCGIPDPCRSFVGGNEPAAIGAEQDGPRTMRQVQMLPCSGDVPDQYRPSGGLAASHRGSTPNATELITAYQLPVCST